MSKEAMKLALEALAVKFSKGWHEGIKIDASDIMLLNDAAQALAEQPAQRKQVGDSRFESWYSEDFDPKGKGTKQQMREAYEAGINDPVPQPAQQEYASFAEWAHDYVQDNLHKLKPAQQLVDCHATGVCVQSGLRAEQPAQQEPVARQYQNRDGVWKDFISEKHYKDTLEDGSWPIRNLYTSPPAQRTWVGLTDEEVINVMPDDDTPMSLGETFSKFAELIEAKLKEKNT